MTMLSNMAAKTILLSLAVADALVFLTVIVPQA